MGEDLENSRPQNPLEPDSFRRWYSRFEQAIDEQEKAA